VGDKESAIAARRIIRGTDLRSLGFNICKARLCYSLLEGKKKSATLLSKGYEKYDPEQPLPEMANYFKQTFKEVIDREKPDIIAYRLSLEAKKASIPYLHFSYGILNLVAHEISIPIEQTISQTFSAKALGKKGDKFEVCDQLISNIPEQKWNNDFRYAALAAWMALDA
jgi:Holliday junction resolvasome RuvABC endonuclease subunit